ncbi:MAG: hypothetical protein AUG06_01940 [Actinobacteria bacterium 13_1_20CM_2_65_11]|nr:MAG: hypothetical protein AUH69_00790 [Actinobacteria bacterium 13_1_40CM_4_65_12]OLE81149.1 MAG: hypothetical protein AUG06_01940 [Actinobacteria bacterium 13_1_20CM_2_65_11]
MRLVAASFGWPFRGAWPSRFAMGVLMVLLLPISFIPLLGYAIAATRTAGEDPTHGPPRWRLSRRLIADGFWTALVLLVLSAPLILAWNPLADVMPLQQVYAHIGAAFLLALPWGLLLLLLMPHGTSRFAATGRPLDLFDFPASLRGVRRDFPAWNVAAAAMVTAWAIGVACVGLLCVGFLPGMFYAILVSAHASATLRPAGISGTTPSSG